MNTLINKTPKRLFTFGCSFTDYKWATWANILAYEFDCEFYNFGKSGAGNTFIANQITQANRYFNFNFDDLVMVCWTNISREDRWTSNNGWITPGNIYSQQDYDSKFIKNWANDIHFALRDFSYIDLVDSYLLDKTNYHFLSMCNLVNNINQWDGGNHMLSNEVSKIADLYSEQLSKILANFYETLWHGNIDYKWRKDWNTVHPHYSDGHPTIYEHYEFLTRVFNYQFSDRTQQAVENLHLQWKNYIKKGYKKTKFSKGLHDMPGKWVDDIHNLFVLKKDRPIPSDLFH